MTCTPAESEPDYGINTATTASAYTPDPDYLAELTRVYGPDSPYDSPMVSIEAAARERAYLVAISNTLAEPTDGSDPIVTELDTAAHSYIPTLEFPTYVDTDYGLCVWANWEATDEHNHEFNICPAAADEFPVLPNGTTEGDHIEAARLIREYIASKAQPTPAALRRS